MKTLALFITVLVWAVTGSLSAGSGATGGQCDGSFSIQPQGDTAFVFFDGMAFPPGWIIWPWGQSTLTVEEGAGATEGTNAIRWVQGDEWGSGWSGFGITFDVPYNMSAVWESDTLTFKMKAEPGTGPIRVQLEDDSVEPRDRVGKVFDPMADGTWYDFAFPLRELEYQDNSTSFDSSTVWILNFMGEASAIVGQVVYIDEIWTGHPTFDEDPPLPPQGLYVATGDYSNLIIWEDVQGEEGEVYAIYYSKSHITSLEDDDLEVVATNIPENTQSATHLLTAPVTDQEVSYYYAMVCTDAAHNASNVVVTPAATTNTAKGIVTISPDPPADLVCDGDLNEWAGIDPIRIYPSLGALSVPNYPVDDDNDCSVDAYLAVDDEFLYMACDVTDDLVEYETGINSWENDRIDVFIGLYDQHGKKHTSYKRGEEPDYHFNFEFNQLIFETPVLGTIYTPDSAWYSYDEKFPSGYVIETRLPWTLIAGTEDEPFTPREGLRIPIDFSIQDRDNGVRQGILTWSPENQDHSWQSPQYWTYTWIGELWEPAAITRGDVNSDGNINVLDILAIANDILDLVPLTGDAAEAADCDGNGTINVLDALGVANVILGIIPDCPGGAAKVDIYPETMELMKSLREYLSPVQFEELMAMVKSFGVPLEYGLAQNHPNPFNPVTTIGFALPVDGQVKLSVFNVLGQEVQILLDGRTEAGYHKVTWNARDLSSGVYFYRLQAGDAVSMKRCLLVK